MRARSQLVQNSSETALVADAASRLSAEAGHTIHNLVASTSDAVQQSSGPAELTVQRLEAVLSEASQLVQQLYDQQDLLRYASVLTALLQTNTLCHRCCV